MNQAFYTVNGHKFGVYQRDEADQSVAAEIFKLKEYRRADPVIRAAKAPLIDAGAHSGFFTLYARALNPAVQIWAVEPEPNNLALLKKHLAENNIGGVKVIAGALAGKSGERHLKISADSHNHRLSPSYQEGAGGVAEGQRKVKAFSLSDFLKNNHLKKISLLKMDIEGAEYEVLAGLTAGEWLTIEALILEYHDGEFGRHGELVKLLRENGFGAEIFPSKFDKTMGFIFAVNKRL